MTTTGQLRGAISGVFPSYAWIMGENGVAYFAHRTAFRPGHFEHAVTNQMVRFAAAVGPRGARANDVQIEVTPAEAPASLDAVSAAFEQLLVKKGLLPKEGL